MHLQGVNRRLHGGMLVLRLDKVVGCFPGLLFRRECQFAGDGLPIARKLTPRAHRDTPPRRALPLVRQDAHTADQPAADRTGGDSVEDGGEVRVRVG